MKTAETGAHIGAQVLSGYTAPHLWARWARATGAHITITCRMTPTGARSDGPEVMFTAATGDWQQLAMLEGQQDHHEE